MKTKDKTGFQIIASDSFINYFLGLKYIHPAYAFSLKKFQVFVKTFAHKRINSTFAGIPLLIFLF